MEPTSFKKGDKCEWRILATHGEKIILNITTLDIPASSNCNLDYLEVLVLVEVLNPIYKYKLKDDILKVF